MFLSLSNFIYRRRWLVLAGGLLFLLVSGIFGTSVFGSLKGGGFDDPASDSSKVIQSFKNELGQQEAQLIVLFTSNNGAVVESPAYRQGVEAVLARVQNKPGVQNITTFYSSGAAQLLSNDRHSTYAVMGMEGDEEAVAKNLKELRPLLTGAAGNLQVRLGGGPAINEEISGQVSKDLEKAETMTFPILAILLILIFGSLVAASLPLAIGGDCYQRPAKSLFLCQPD